MTLFDLISVCVAVPIICYTLFRIFKLGIDHERELSQRRFDYLESIHRSLDLLHTRIDYFVHSSISNSDDDIDIEK